MPMLTHRSTLIVASLALLLDGWQTADAAWINRHLLHELTSRPTVADDVAPALDAARLAACLRTARDLDRIAVSLDNQMIVIQDTTSRVDYMQYLDRPHLPRLDLTDKQASDERERQLAKRADMQHLLDRDRNAYQKQLATYQDGVKAFERDCAGNFRKPDIEAATARLRAEQ
jgi:hypothetical protein